MKSETIVIGIDGGGTKTAGRLADHNAVTLADHIGGPSNMQVIGAEACAEMFHKVITYLCNKAHCSIEDVKSVAIGLAGAGRASDRLSVHNYLEKKLKLPNTKLTVVSDADIALEAAYGEQTGIIVIAGTGSIVYGRNLEGEISRVGGWGPILGDPGSGSDIGLKALQKLSRIFDGLDKESELSSKFADYFGINSPETLINKVYKENIKPSKLTRPVFEAALMGDDNALQVLNAAAEGLSNLIESYLAGFSKMQEVPVTLKGGMLETDTVYRQILMQKLRKLPYPVSVNPFSKKTVDGAINLALRMTGDYTSSNPIK